MSEQFKSMKELEASLSHISESPSEVGSVAMIVSRPVTEQREILIQCELDTAQGLIGDNWLERGDKHTADGSADLGRQLTLMNARAVEAISNDESRWPEAGDQFYVDFDLSAANIPPGTQLALGEAVVEVTALPHLGCGKFSARFGRDATMFVNSKAGKAMNLRGINAKLVKPGRVSKGDSISKMS